MTITGLITLAFMTLIHALTTIIRPGFLSHFSTTKPDVPFESVTFEPEPKPKQKDDAKRYFSLKEQMSQIHPCNYIARKNHKQKTHEEGSTVCNSLESPGKR